MFFPKHEILFVKKDGTKKSIMFTDCTTKEEVKEEVNYYLKLNNLEKEICKEYVFIQYVDSNKEVLYEYLIEKFFE